MPKLAMRLVQKCKPMVFAIETDNASGLHKYPGKIAKTVNYVRIRGLAQLLVNYGDVYSYIVSEKLEEFASSTKKKLEEILTKIAHPGEVFGVTVKHVDKGLFLAEVSYSSEKQSRKLPETKA